MNDHENAAGAVSELLDAEREALLKGDIEGLERLAQMREQALDELSQANPSDGALVRLHAKAERNRLLLLAAARGLKTVAERIKVLRQGNAGLRTYDQNGRRPATAARPVTLKRRA